MAKKLTEGDHIRLSYKDAALKLLFKFDRPSKNDVYHHLCRQDHCPNVDNRCDFLFGSLGGINCQHVINVKSMVDKLVTILNDTYAY